MLIGVFRTNFSVRTPLLLSKRNMSVKLSYVNPVDWSLTLVFADVTRVLIHTGAHDGQHRLVGLGVSLLQVRLQLDEVLHGLPIALH